MHQIAAYKQNEIPIKTICAYCDTIIRDGRLINGMVSHGICNTCHEIEIAKITGAISNENSNASITLE